MTKPTLPSAPATGRGVLKDTSAFQVYSRPNFFEIFLSDHLQESIYPAYRSLVSYLVGRFGNEDPSASASLNTPSAYLARCLQWLRAHKSGVFFGVSGCVEAIQLRANSASLSESFLGLRRVPASGQATELSSKQRLLSLVCLVGVPWAVDQEASKAIQMD